MVRRSIIEIGRVLREIHGWGLFPYVVAKWHKGFQLHLPPRPIGCHGCNRGLAPCLTIEVVEDEIANITKVKGVA